jgi:hypothetical protein
MHLAYVVTVHEPTAKNKDFQYGEIDEEWRYFGETWKRFKNGTHLIEPPEKVTIGETTTRTAIKFPG